MDWLGSDEWEALALSLRVSLWATIVSLPLGVFVAYALARWSFPGKQVLNGIVHLPLILPPVGRQVSWPFR
jgi:molybdate transport system permease protein